MIRITAADQLFNIVTKCSISTSSFLAFIALLFSAVEVRTGTEGWEIGLGGGGEEDR